MDIKSPQKVLHIFSRVLENFSSFGFVKGRLVCRQKPNVLFVRWAFCMLPNGLGLGEVGEIEAQMFNKPLMLIEVRMFKFSTSAPILPNPCSSDTSGEQKK